MKSLPNPCFEQVRIMRQRGVVLFFTLIALLAMSLAAVALIRSVDTSTMIAGNLAFKQSATTSGDAGIEAAITWLTATETAANLARVGTSNTIYNDPTHPFNNNNIPAYYSSANSALSLTNPNPTAPMTGIQWDDNDSVLVGTDASGNTIRYVIQRMCRNANALTTLSNCLFSEANQDASEQDILLPQEVCTPVPGAPCPTAGQTPQVRITARTTGPKNTVSYVQAFVY